tara:strand:+ start:7951 stop:8091 length:141 start_codon:yes stop_codon:yes gene_type:complete
MKMVLNLPLLILEAFPGRAGKIVPRVFEDQELRSAKNRAIHKSIFK